MGKGRTPKVINPNIINDLLLEDGIDRTFGGGGRLGSVIIMFQMIDLLLRLNILLSVCPTDSSIVSKILDQIDRFPRLVECFSFIRYDADLQKRLLKFNEKRNRIIHKLFYVKSVESLKGDIKQFCDEGEALGDILRRFLQKHFPARKGD